MRSVLDVDVQPRRAAGQLDVDGVSGDRFSTGSRSWITCSDRPAPAVAALLVAVGAELPEQPGGARHVGEELLPLLP